METISIGIVQRPHGVRGEVKVMPKTDFIKERFKKGNTVTMVLQGKERIFEIESSRMHGKSVLVKFVGLDNLNDVEFFHRGEFMIPRDDLHELPEDQFYFVDLVGCDVFVDKQSIGAVIEIIETPAHPVMRVKGNERDILIPFVDRFVASVDLNLKQIVVNWMEGL